MEIKRKIGLRRRTFSSEDTRIGYLAVEIFPNEVRIENPIYKRYDGYDPKLKKLVGEENPYELRAYKNLASARLKASKDVFVIAEVLISGHFKEYEDGFLFQEYRLLQLVVTHCAACKRAAEFYVQPDGFYGEISFICSTHSNIARGFRPVADVMAFFNPEESSFDVRRLNKIVSVNSVCDLGVPLTSSLGPNRWIPTRLPHDPQTQQKIAVHNEFDLLPKASWEERLGYDDGSVKVALAKELPPEVKPPLDPSEELFKLRRGKAVDQERIHTMLKALRWKETMLQQREQQLRSLGIRLDEGEKSWQEGKGEA